ncbi:hypothetical protein Anas_06990 [Armadillidium nasatum]|uniref:Uncharacterized protein n=1 Tax=Armadillidium nasatum TaxID=96803 RepID=A0A5N5SW55_9CRUS|nr:hypothetical protein Anas_06990 [Armadillidium nasatum]
MTIDNSYFKKSLNEKFSPSHVTVNTLENSNSVEIYIHCNIVVYINTNLMKTCPEKKGNINADITLLSIWWFFWLRFGGGFACWVFSILDHQKVLFD